MNVKTRDTEGGQNICLTLEQLQFNSALVHFSFKIFFPLYIDVPQICFKFADFYSIGFKNYKMWIYIYGFQFNLRYYMPTIN